MKARDVMVSPVVTVGENDTVGDVAKLLIVKRISAVQVADSAGKVIGIVTEGTNWKPGPNDLPPGGCRLFPETVLSMTTTSNLMRRKSGKS